MGGFVMKSVIRDFFAQNRITLYGVLPFSECAVIRPDLLERRFSGTPRSVLIYAVPYYTGPGQNISCYAISRDYHLYFEALAQQLQKLLAGCSSASFADHSPFDEVRAAVRAGLGVRGKNRLLITREYGSYVFIGETVTDLPAGEFGLPVPAAGGGECPGCGACLAACPTGCLRGTGESCLSALTQKKGALTPGEEDAIRSAGLVWGCDRCQQVCPLNRKTDRSPIPFFSQERLPGLTGEILESMDEESFRQRAYSWRGRAVIRRNLNLFTEES